jgi:cell division protein FtsI (penicillin-binding protein 3)
MRQNRAHVRLLIVAGAALLWSTAVIGRLGYLQLVRHTEYLTRALRQQQRTIEITPKRGVIYDRNMHALAISVPVKSAYAVPSEIVDEEMAARLLSGVVNVPADVLLTKFQSSRQFAWVSRKLPPEKVEAVAALNLKGIYFQEENQRFYPKRELAAHVLGFVDPDEKGLAGIEYELDGKIRGEGEKIVVMADARQHWFDGGEAHRKLGANVVLTLDEKIQYIAQRELGAAIAKTHAIAGSVIVMNPNNGEILALANWPTFNPNAPNSVTPESRMNRSVSAVYEPGSTFKLITLAAAFDQGVARPDDVYDCENGSIVLAGHRIHDHKRFSLLNVSEILAKSSDVGAIKVALKVGEQKFYDYIRAFGFGEPTGLDLPGESRGILRPLERWSPISIGAVAMGQEVGVTPIQLITAVSAIGNGGLLYKPHVVRTEAEVSAGQNTSLGALPEPRRAIRPETAATLTRAMEGVILAGGTAPLARLDGWTAAGKTGSAQKIDPVTHHYSPTQFVASFTGFAPINNPAVTILIALDSPVGLHEGGSVAAPVFKRIAEQVLPYLEVPRDVPVNAQLVHAAYKKQEAAAAVEETSTEDFSTIDFPTQSGDSTEADSELPVVMPTASAGRASGGSSASTSTTPPEVAMRTDEGVDVEVPDFSGMTMREVTQICLRLRLEPVLIGSSLATQQAPAPGSKVKAGAKVTVEFGALAYKTVKAPHKGARR